MNVYLKSKIASTCPTNSERYVGHTVLIQIKQKRICYSTYWARSKWITTTSFTRSIPALTNNSTDDIRMSRAIRGCHRRGAVHPKRSPGGPSDLDACVKSYWVIDWRKKKFKGGDNNIKGSRPLHLREKAFCVAESDEEGNLKVDMSEIFIEPNTEPSAAKAA